MRHASPATGLVLVALLVSPADAVRAQEVADVAAPRAPVAYAPEASLGASSETPQWRSRVFNAVGGAVLGAGIGYFASQIARGDWNEGPGQRQIDRPLWAAVGGSVGFTLGFSFPILGRGTSTSPDDLATHRRSILTGDEIREHVVPDVYEAVRLLRPEWLVDNAAPDVIGRPETGRKVAYLDDARLGGLQELRAVHPEAVERVQWVPAAAATARWGVGHNHGVVQVITRD